MSIPFWFNDPTILLNKDYIFELWPFPSMCYEQKINAIARLIILCTILGYVSTMSMKILGIGIITLGVIYFMGSQKRQEGFEEHANATILGPSPTPLPADMTTNPVTLETILKSDYQLGNKKNPFGNVLLTDIMDNPERKPAAPAFNPDILDDITTSIKKTVQYLNPGIKNTNKQMFSSLTDKFYLDQSNRAFFSTANTKVANDQGAFAQYLYGNMPSCRDGDGMACVQDNYRYTLY